MHLLLKFHESHLKYLASVKVQRSRFGIFRVHCIVMDARSGRSSVPNHGRIGGPRHCLRQDPEQKQRALLLLFGGTGFYAGLPVRYHTLTAGPSHTQYHSEYSFLSLPLSLSSSCHPPPFFCAAFEAFHLFRVLNSH